MRALCCWHSIMSHGYACITTLVLCRLSGIMSADIGARRERGREAIRSTLQSQRSSSLETGKARIKMGRRTKQVKPPLDTPPSLCTPRLCKALLPLFLSLEFPVVPASLHRGVSGGQGLA